MQVVPNNSGAQATVKKVDERILVVPRSILFKNIDAWNGFKSLDSLADFQAIVEQHKLFLWRSEVEQDPSYKQIIPYLVFRFQGKYFVMKRRSTASEQRLKDKYTNGIGGHIRQEDIDDKTLFQWAEREFDEEVCYQGNLTVKPLGLINDDRDEVGRVHIGFAFLLEGDSDQIAIRAEHKEGYLLTLKECMALYPSMESWSQYVLDYLLATEGE
ncbi:MAG: hypothetical protein WCT20_01185 [Candidatus Babeliales bacterium]|jgi:predicted NUDIX family phosphoesterase